MIPYSRQQIDESDINAVVEVMRSDFLTTGPMVRRFEDKIADYVGVEYAVAVSSGTAALHAAMYALGIGPGDAVIIPTLTFVATAHAVTFTGAMPMFADVKESTLLLDVESVKQRISEGRAGGWNIRAIIAVDYAGQPCDYTELRELASEEGIVLVADAAHSLGASYKAVKVGSLASMTCFSFHPLKTITTAEGGMVVTGDPIYAEKIRGFRNLGRDSIANVNALGYNYRLSDIHCALGISQLVKIQQHLQKRRDIADRYNEEPMLAGREISFDRDRTHSRHLYVIRVENRDSVKVRLLVQNIQTQLHYTPVHMMPFYRRMRHLCGCEVRCPVAEKAAREILSLPIYPGLTEEDQNFIIVAVKGELNA